MATVISLFFILALAWTGAFVWIYGALICLGIVPAPCLKRAGHENINQNSNAILHRGSPQGEGNALQRQVRSIKRTVFRRSA